MEPDERSTPEGEVPEEEIPLGQRLYESPFILLAIGLAVMLICFTGWGLWEIARMTQAPLP